MARLFDLVRCREAALRPAFFYALGDTLVAQDLEQAARIAYGADKRWARAVTLQVGHPAGLGPHVALSDAAAQQALLGGPSGPRSLHGRMQNNAQDI